MTYSGVIDRYRSLLDVPGALQTVTLLEGNTPLIPVPRLAGGAGRRTSSCSLSSKG